MSAILIFDFQKKKTVTFFWSRLSKLKKKKKKKKKNYIWQLHFPKTRGNKNKQWTHSIPVKPEKMPENLIIILILYHLLLLSSTFQQLTGIKLTAGEPWWINHWTTDTKQMAYHRKVGQRDEPWFFFWSEKHDYHFQKQGKIHERKQITNTL